MKKLRIALIIILSLSGSLGNAQDRFASIKNELDVLKVDQMGLSETVEMSVDGVELHQFIRGLGINHKLNLSVDSKLTDPVSNTFSDAQVADILLFLCREYDLQIEMVGSIISIKRFQRPPAVPLPKIEQIPEIDFNELTDFLSLDLKNDTLSKVAREITKRTLKNVVLAPDIQNELVSVFIQNRPFDKAIDKLCYANGLTMAKEDGEFYLISKAANASVAKNSNASDRMKGNRKNVKNSANRSSNSEFEMTLEDNGHLTIHANDMELAEVIKYVSQEMSKNYFLNAVPEGKTDLYIENASYDDFLTYLLLNTKFTYKNQDNVYLIGEKSSEILRSAEMIRLENRTVEKVIDVIPEDLKTDMTVSEFLDLNAIIVTGSYQKIEKVKDFLRVIDQPVPTVLIEVLIVDFNKNRSVSGGINIGLGDGPETTGGNIAGGQGVSMNLTAESINNLINSFNGFGLVNLGNVTGGFYANIQALETDGILRMRSTPKLSTLNGHEANLSIGETEYYLEETNNFIGTQNPSLATQQNYRSVNADLSINIKPTVSGNDEVTLEITVAQSDFTTKIAPTAPPNSVTRDFESKVRIKNGDMILLGGLESKGVSKSGTGVPFISRVPVLKWFFGSRSHTKSKTKLNVFIKATVIH